MKATLIPTDSYPHTTRQVRLGDTAFQLRTYWNTRCTCWYADLLTVDGEPVSMSIKLVTGFPLLRRVAHPLRPVGELVFVDAQGKFGRPTLEEMGTRYKLVYIEASASEILAASAERIAAERALLLAGGPTVPGAPLPPTPIGSTVGWSASNYLFSNDPARVPHNGSYTVWCWVKAPDITTSQTVWDVQTSDIIGAEGFRLRIASGAWRFTDYDPSGGSATIASNAIVDKWTSIACVQDGTAGRLYVGGYPAGTFTKDISARANDSYMATIGVTAAFSTPLVSTVEVAQWAAYDSALTPTQILALDAFQRPSIAGAKSILALNGGATRIVDTGTLASDFSQQGNNLADGLGDIPRPAQP